MLAGHDGRVAGLRERVAHMAQHQRVVVHHEDGLALAVGRRALGARCNGLGGGPGGGLGGDRQGEGEAGALAGSGALRPDTPAMGLDQPLADGEAEPEAVGAGAVGRPAMPAEEPRQPLGRDAPALVDDRDRDMHAVAPGLDADRRGLRRVPRGVGQKVVQHLLDALAVGHDPRQVGWQVDQHGVPPAAGDEGVARPVDEQRHLGRLGRDRERAGVQAPGVEQVGDQGEHAVRLLGDDAEELPRLGRGERARGVEHRAGRALDGGERRAQLVAHHAEELGALPVELVQRRQILQRRHHRCHGAVAGGDRGDVDQRPDAAPVGHRQHQLLVAHGLGETQRAADRTILKGDLPALGEAAGHHPHQLLERPARQAQAFQDPPGLPVDRHRTPGRRVEHQDADRRGLDQRLEPGPRLPLGPVGAGVGDRRRGLRGEQHQGLLVLVAERPAVLPSRRDRSCRHARRGGASARPGRSRTA